MEILSGYEFIQIKCNESENSDIFGKNAYEMVNYY